MGLKLNVRICDEGLPDGASVAYALHAIAEQIEICEPIRSEHMAVPHGILAPSGDVIGEWRLNADDFTISLDKSGSCTKLGTRRNFWILSVWDGDTPISYCHTSESDAWKEALRIIIDAFEEDEKQLLNDWHSAGEFGFIRIFLGREFPCSCAFNVEEVCF
jgi:hypothetical protein